MKKIVVLCFAVSLFAIGADLGLVKRYMIESYLVEKLGNKEVFIDEKSLHVKGNFAILQTPPKIEDGSDSYNYFLDVGYNICLEKKDSFWRVIYDLSRSDVPNEEQWEEIRENFPKRFPKELLSPFWQEGLK